MSEHETSPHHRADVQVAQDGDKVTLKAPADGVTLSADEAEELAGRVYEAALLARGENPEDDDRARVPMQYVRVAAERMDFDAGDGETPPPEDDMGDATSAEVHCWIKDQTFGNALHVVSGSLIDSGWMVLEVLEHRRAARADFADTEYLQYFEQALVESELFLYELEEPEDEGTADAP